MIYRNSYRSMTGVAVVHFWMHPIPPVLLAVPAAMWHASVTRRPPDMTVQAVTAPEARQRRRSSAALGRRSLIRVPVPRAPTHSPVSHLASYQPATRSAFAASGPPPVAVSSQPGVPFPSAAGAP